MKQKFDDIEVRGNISLTGNRNLNGCLVMVRNEDGSITETTIDNSTLKLNDEGKLSIYNENEIKVVNISQSDYDALQTKDSNTLYLIPL